MNVYVDADACPAKNEIIEVCKRHQLVPIFVSNQEIAAIAESSCARMQVVTGAFDAADNWIIEQAQPGDLVLTADLLLAQRAAKNKVDAMTFSGRALSDEVIHDLVARRNIEQHLREMNIPSYKPRAYGKANRSSFKAALHEWVERQKRRGGS